MPTQLRVQTAIDDKIAAVNDRLVLQFMEENPNDWAGLDELSLSLTGQHVEVWLEGESESITATHAADLIEQQAAADKLGDVSIQNIPSDAFTVSISRIPLSTWNARISGKWNFRDNYVGTDGNADFASLGFAIPNCVTMHDHAITTYKWTNAQTNVGSLRSSNVGAKAPIWNVVDTTKNHERSNDHGTVSVRLKNGCGKVQYNNQAAFQYEANQGAGAVSVSASIGVISASYGGRAMVFEKGTTPITFAI